MTHAGRITVNSPQQITDKVDRLMAMKGMNQTDVIHRAVRLLDMWETAVQGGAHFLRSEPDGSLTRVELL